MTVSRATIANNPSGLKKPIGELDNNAVPTKRWIACHTETKLLVIQIKFFKKILLPKLSHQGLIVEDLVSLMPMVADINSSKLAPSLQPKIKI